MGEWHPGRRRNVRWHEGSADRQKHGEAEGERRTLRMAGGGSRDEGQEMEQERAQIQLGGAGGLGFSSEGGGKHQELLGKVGTC